MKKASREPINKMGALAPSIQSCSSRRIQEGKARYYWDVEKASARPSHGVVGDRILGTSGFL